MPLYTKLFQNQFGSAPINWASDTIKVSLHTSSYAPDQDAHGFKSDLTNEVTGTGYTAGGATLGTKTNVITAATNTTTLDAADTVWPTSTITARYAAIYKDTGTASTSPLLGWVDFGTNQSSSAGDFTIQWNASGIAALVAN